MIDCRTVKRYFYTSPTGRTKSYHSLFMACKQAAKEELRTIVLGPLVEFEGQLMREKATMPWERDADDPAPAVDSKKLVMQMYQNYLETDQTIPDWVKNTGFPYRFWVERRAKELAKEWRAHQ